MQHLAISYIFFNRYCLQTFATYHYLNFSLAHLQVMFIVNIHSFQCTFNTIVSLHQEYYGKTTWGQK